MSGSSFRNVHGETWRKELTYLDVKVNKGAGNNLIKGNSLFYGVPWNTNGGSLGVFSQSKVGKIDIANLKLIRGHASTIQAFDFCPHIETVVCTGSRDPEIKIWKFPDEGVVEDITTPQTTLLGHTKRITGVYWHPAASNVLASTSGDNVAKIWDVEKSACKIDLKGHDDVILGADWNCEGQLLTACQDGKFRLYDVRTKQDPIGMQTAHEGTKGFQALWLAYGAQSDNKSGGRQQYFGTVGWSKASDRQLAVWDNRKLTQPATVQVIDVSSSILTPFYDATIGALYLAEKGNKIFVYEIVPQEPFALSVAKFESKSSLLGHALLPKRINNVMNCEVARFLAVSGETVETISFTVPRKDKTLFQEDLFPFVASGQAAQTAADWFSGKNAPLATKSIRPSGVTSVYDVSEEEGGRSKVKDQQRVNAANVSNSNLSASKMEQMTEGNLFLGIDGFLWTTWQPSYVIMKGKTLFAFEAKDAAVPLAAVQFEQMTDIKPQEGEDLILEIYTTIGKTTKLKSLTKPERDSWVASIKDAKVKAARLAMEEQKEKEGSALANAQDTPVSPKSPRSNPNTPRGASQEQLNIPPQPDKIMEGYLQKFTEGFFYNYWHKTFFRCKDGILYTYASDSSSEPAEQVLLEKVTSVYEASNIENAPNCFKISTATRTWTLQAKDAPEMKFWIDGLDELIKKIKGDKADEGNEQFMDASRSAVVEGWLSVKTGVFSLWNRRWVTAVGGDVLLFKQQTAPQPIQRLQLAQCNAVEISEKDTELALQLRMKDGTIWHFLGQTREERDDWLSALNELKFDSLGLVDLIEAFKIDLTALAKELNKNIEDSLQNVVDLDKVKKGQFPIFIRIQGKRHVRANVVPTSWKSMYTDGVFILDMGTKVYQWNGKKASRIQKAKGLDISSRLKMKERGGNCQVVTIEQGVEDDVKPFWDVLGGKNEITNSVPIDALDKDEAPVKLYRITDNKINLVHQGRPPSKEKLNSKYTFVLECGTEFFVWTGKSATKNSKKLGLKLVQTLQKGVQGFFVITRLAENGETTLWKEKFKDYPANLPISTQKVTIVSNISSKREQKPIDIKAMHSGVPPQPTMYDDGRGKMEIWKVEEFDKIPVPKELYGHFWAGSSFLFKYTYMEGNNEKVLLYFWQGRDSSINEKGTSAYLTKELDDKIAGTGKQIRVPQDYEPLHFLTVFKGKFVIHAGPFTPDFDVNVKLYDIRGKSEVEVFAKEAALNASALNGGHCFVVADPSVIYIWHGTYANQFEKNYAAEFAKSLTAKKSREVKTITEGSEDDKFWQLLGGKKSYYSPNTLKRQCFPKLFVFSDASGAVEFEEVFEVVQDSLNPQTAIIIDAKDTIWVWFGKGSSILEQKWSLRTAKDYVAALPPNEQKIPLYVTKQFCEPNEFTTVFHAWSKTKIPKDQLSNDRFQKNLDDVLKDYLREVYSYAELLVEPLPIGVDPTLLETYLTTEEFEKVLGMNREEYDKLPNWKKDSLKKNVGLF